MKKRNLKSVATVIEKRTEKRKEQLKLLEEKRQSQWEDELLKAAVSALPRSTPKAIEEKMSEIKRHHPADAPTAENALDAIGLLKENVNGSHPAILGSDPYKLLWAETLTACSKQTAKWKLLPMTLVHPFTPRLTVMTSLTGKKISRSDMLQMKSVADGLKAELDTVYDAVVNNGGKVATEKEMMDKLRDMYPEVLVTQDNTAINSILDTSTATRTAAEVPDWALGTGYVDTDGEPDGFVLDLEDIHTDITTDNNDDDDDDDEENDEGDVDKEESIDRDTNDGEKGHDNDDKTRDEKDQSADSVNIEALSLEDGRGSPINTLPRPVATENENENDFSTSLTDSYVDLVVGSAKKTYNAMPPPPRHMGLYSMVPPLESSPKAPTPVPSTSSRHESKREASPLHMQPPKLLRVGQDQAELRELRHQLAESNKKVESLGQCISEMQLTMQQQRWEQHQRSMNQRPPQSNSRQNLQQQQQQPQHNQLQQQQLQQQSRQQQRRQQQKELRRLNQQTRQLIGLEQRQRSDQQSRSRQPPAPNTPRPNRRRTNTAPNVSPIRNSLGSRQTAEERTRQLIGREALGGLTPGPIIHDSHVVRPRRSYDRDRACID